MRSFSPNETELDVEIRTSWHVYTIYFDESAEFHYRRFSPDWLCLPSN